MSSCGIPASSKGVPRVFFFPTKVDFHYASFRARMVNFLGPKPGRTHDLFIVCMSEILHFQKYLKCPQNLEESIPGETCAFQKSIRTVSKLAPGPTSPTRDAYACRMRPAPSNDAMTRRTSHLIFTRPSIFACSRLKPPHWFKSCMAQSGCSSSRAAAAAGLQVWPNAFPSLRYEAMIL